jgi:hypothetical protein
MIRNAMHGILIVALLTGAAATLLGAAPVAQLFVTADRCMACHNGLVTQSGQDVSIGVDWRASMMANSARDPYWQAAVRREILEHPTARAAIENECSACHMPMARFSAKANGELGGVFAHLPVVHGDDPADLIAADGVSCAMCHQITDEKLGEDDSFTAGFEVDTTTAPGERNIFGPYDVDAGRTRLMRSASRFVPTRADHIQSSELCATCHTLITHALSPEGEVVGEFPEQVPYLEWRHSAYAGEQSCQSCHMPVVREEMPITGVMGIPRQEMSRHVFRGGNFFMPKLLNAARLPLGVAALPQELEVTSLRTARHLESAAGQLSVEPGEIAGGILSAEVVITNLAGHKLPSAYPSRRVWVRFTVRDADGRTLFESGRFNPDGSVEGNDNDEDPARFEAHRGEIDSPDQVQIYEAVMADPGGSVTTVLLSAVRYAKDNRLLPNGFDKGTAGPDIATHGLAVVDDDFVGGGDSVRYRVDVGGARGPFEVEAELWYQPIAYRWAHNLRQQEAEEIDRFVSLYEGSAEASAVILARDTVMVVDGR